MCPFQPSPLSSTCSDPDFHFHQLIPVAFVVADGVYKRIWVCRRYDRNMFIIREAAAQSITYHTSLFKMFFKNKHRINTNVFGPQSFSSWNVNHFKRKIKYVMPRN